MSTLTSDPTLVTSVGFTVVTSIIELAMLSALGNKSVSISCTANTEPTCNVSCVQLSDGLFDVIDNLLTVPMTHLQESQEEFNSTHRYV